MTMIRMMITLSYGLPQVLHVISMDLVSKF